MPTDNVTPDEFLSRMTQCFAEPSKKGSIWLTHKRMRYGEEESKMDVDGDEGESSRYEVFLRCNQKEGRTFSTRIPSTSLPAFHAKYGSLLKASMAPQMRKRDKKKEKARADAAAKKKKELYTDVVVGDAGKRGKGRRQRQRKVKAQRKKEVERERIESKSIPIVKMASTGI